MENRLTWVVKFYNVDKAFGFISEDGTNEDRFMHISGIAKDDNGEASFIPQQGERVSYVIIPGKKGDMAGEIMQEGGQSNDGSAGMQSEEDYDDSAE